MKIDEANLHRLTRLVLEAVRPPEETPDSYADSLTAICRAYTLACRELGLNLEQAKRGLELTWKIDEDRLPPHLQVAGDE